MGIKYAVIAAAVACALGWTALPAAGATCNIPPTAVSESISIDLGQHGIADVLANDHDSGGQALSVTISSSDCPSQVSAIVNPSQQTITVSASAAAAALSCQITYRVSDGAGGTATANLAVVVAVPESIFADGFESGNTSAWSESTVQE